MPVYMDSVSPVIMFCFFIYFCRQNLNTPLCEREVEDMVTTFWESWKESFNLFLTLC